MLRSQLVSKPVLPLDAKHNALINDVPPSPPSAVGTVEGTMGLVGVAGQQRSVSYRPDAAASASPGAGAPPPSPLGHLMTVVRATSAGADVIRYSVWYVLLACCVLIVVSLLGLLVSCCPASQYRGLLATGYLCLGLPAWVLLVFVSVVALASRDEADELVQLYWKCLTQAAPAELRGDYPAAAGGGDGGGDEWYGSRGLLHVEAASAACISAALALLLGMVCACRVIGWRVVARVSVLLISVSTGLLGAALLGAGAVMAATTSLKPLLDEVVIGLGVAVLLLSLLGVVGSLRESRCLLRTYAAVLLLALLALIAGCVVLAALGAGTLGGWLDQGWHIVQDQGLLITREEFQQLVDKHILGLITISSLVALVLGLDCIMVCVLQSSIGKQGRRDETEMEQLVVTE